MINRLLPILLLAVLYSTPVLAASPMHPDIELQDRDGINVLESGAPVSPLKTCGACHDADYITETSFHAFIGLGTYGVSPIFSAADFLDPTTYSYPLARDRTGGSSTAAAGSEPADQATWLVVFGDRHPGLPSGPTEILPDGDARGYEYNCFLCHLSSPDNTARIAAIIAGDHTAAASATLAKTGVLAPDGGYDPQVFTADGRVSAQTLGITNPSAKNCGQCHGPVHYGDTPFTIDPADIPVGIMRTGEVFSPQRPADSGLNLAGKAGLTASWDIHAARLLDCADCHFAANNPAVDTTGPGAPSHLAREVRRMPIGEYIHAPDHSLARGYGSLPAPSGFPAGNMRRCSGCHDPATAHTWLPFAGLHFEKLDCEACHIPRIHAPAPSMVDWTMLTAQSTPQVEYRGIDGTPGDPAALITGYEPALSRRLLPDGSERYGPANLQATWIWVSGETGRPVPMELLNQAMFLAGRHHPRLVRAMDSDGDHQLSGNELRLTDDQAVLAVTARLEAVGVESPRIKNLIRHYGIHHGVVGAAEALRDCSECHSRNSRLAPTVTLGSYIPGDDWPVMVATSHFAYGSIWEIADGGITNRNNPRSQPVYLAGFHRWPQIDLLGGVLFALVLFGVCAHAALRILAARRLNGGGR